MVDMVPVKSSNIESIGHEDGHLHVKFKGGSIYHYSNVPADVFQKLLLAPSVGKFLSTHIKGKFNARQL